MNLILRRCLANLNMVMIRRDYYDAAAREDVPVCRQSIFKKQNKIF
jgi:hypothetical protein